ncbi:hypothetical protein [Streptomyces sp. CBMA156]|uniref:hypothetical protein n=1 Tax=Streptomyces sp. CBMA156 TaxID=1930280 RepID=UPI0016619BC8|nr:hypothetical protein [Streptomyces sp. CBMA156]MBD0675671.1 hypothetical protein [Streptomyces sp. CBMA156]
MERTEEFGLDMDGLLSEMAALYAREDGDSAPPLMPLGGIGRQEGERVVDLDAPLLGHATREIRDLLKRGQPYGLDVRDAQRAVHLDRARCLELLAAAVEAGYLAAPEDLHEPRHCHTCRTDDCEYHEHRTWKLTPAGRSLAHASGRKPSTRKNADALVAKVVKAAEAVNAAPDATLWWVREIRAVGPYADDGQEQLLHVDLAVDLRPRLDDPAEQRKAEQRLRDAARDRGEQERVWDMVGYGHWQTRLALAGRSKVVRLFRPAQGLKAPVLFQEERDLTTPAVPSAPYRRPAETPLEACSWCRRTVPAARVARRGCALASSPVALCEQCLSLGWTDGLQYQGSWQVWAWPVVRDLRGSLPQAPFHEAGCALCGREDAVERPWWPGDDRNGSGTDGQEPVVMRLCDVCPGLLELVDAPGREGWWCARHQAACLTGMHALLHQGASADAAPGTRKARKAPRLTPLHREVLDLVAEHGALSAWDLARAPFSQDHQDSRWWQVRLAHLFDHRLITGVRNGSGEDRELVRATSEAERDLAAQLRALHTPGPVWDGERVVEPAPPAGWPELRGQAEHTAALMDQEALRRRADHPVPEAPRGRWG